MADKKTTGAAQSQWDNHDQPVAPLPAPEPGEWQHPSWPIPKAQEEKQLVVTEDYKNRNTVVYGPELDLIVGEEIAELHGEPDAKKTEQNLQLAFQKMYREIDDSTGQSKTA